VDSTPTISFCMIVRNGAATLASCLESVAALCDEMIVVDTGSSDASEDIARSFGARVIQVRWMHDFAAARNMYLAEAQCSWILSIDADEFLGPLDGLELRARLAQIPLTAFLFNIRSYFLKNEFSGPLLPSRLSGEVLPGVECMISRTVRLFPRVHQVRYCYPIHESIIPSLRKHRIPIRSCSIPIHHLGYLAGTEQRKAKGLRYRELGLKKITQYPGCFLGYLELGNVYLHEKRFQDAERMFQESIHLRPTCSDAHLLLALALLQQGKYSECRTRIEATLRRFPHNVDAIHLMCTLAQLEAR
jgi:glycosyltransferase involved in cell wall biosynthesis